MKNWTLFIVIVFLLAACSLPGEGESGLATPQPDSASTDSAPALPTAAPAPVTLTICTGQEPNTLYPYGSPNTAARNVLAALYDGPMDGFISGNVPVILEVIPSIQNGDAQLAAVPVKRGELVVDANGNVSVLDFGLRVYPSGCNDQACVETYDGRDGFTMDQMIVTFHIKPGITWSDGTPLTAADSVYAYQVAVDPGSRQSSYLLDRTQAYEEVDELTTQWWGRPGFIDSSYSSNFWSPFPKHLWGSLRADQLLVADHTLREPLGWGAYVFEEWIPGELIRMSRNPAYFRSEEGLPHFDYLVYRFMPNAESAISALSAGNCDLLDSSLRLDGQLDLLTQMEKDGLLKLVVAATPIMERLDFGINPASYDDGYAPGAGDRQNLFGDVRTRQALAYCIDRQEIIDTVLLGYTVVPNSFVSPYHPVASQDVALYSYDVAAAADLLTQAGWLDTDQDASTPRVAVNVAGVAPGTLLTVTLTTTQALQRRQVSEIIAEGLGSCGVGVELNYLDQASLYASGPQGVLFGRQFDLAEYAIGVLGTEPACSWFLSGEIPSAQNQWLGMNVSGYSNPDYDELCLAARRSIPGTSEYTERYHRLQQINANDLPSIPLYLRLRVAAARPDLCSFTIDLTSSGDLWRIEEFAVSPACRQE